MLDSVLSVALRDEKGFSARSGRRMRAAGRAYEVEVGQDEGKTNGDDAVNQGGVSKETPRRERNRNSRKAGSGNKEDLHDVVVRSNL